MLFGYARASKADGFLILQQQRDALLAAGATAERLYEDRGCGRSERRPGLDACLRSLRSGDILVVWRLERLGRNLRHLVNLVHDLAGRGIGLKVLNGEGAAINITAANGQLVSAIFAALAEFERELGVERSCARQASERLRGRPHRLTVAQLRIAQAAMRKPETRVTELCAELGVAMNTLYRYVDPSGELRPSGMRLLGLLGTAPRKPSSG
jgi:DNA invertase Pin-like site-specific DNA recombinase